MLLPSSSLSRSLSALSLCTLKNWLNPLELTFCGRFCYFHARVQLPYLPAWPNRTAGMRKCISSHQAIHWIPLDAFSVFTSIYQTAMRHSSFFLKSCSEQVLKKTVVCVREKAVEGYRYGAHKGTVGRVIFVKPATIFGLCKLRLKRQI